MDTQTVKTVDDLIGAARQRRDTIAQATGVMPLHQVVLQTEHLLKAGILLDLDLHGFGCFDVGADWADYGVGDHDSRKARHTKGRKALLPDEWRRKLASFETRLRATFDKWSLDIEGFRPWRYFTVDGYWQWQSEHNRITAELDEWLAQVAQEWPQIEAQNVIDFRLVAHDAWQAYQGAYQVPVPYKDRTFVELRYFVEFFAKDHAELDPDAAYQAALGFWNTYQAQNKREVPVLTAAGVFETYAEFEAHMIATVLARMPISGDTQASVLTQLRNLVWADYRSAYVTTPQELLAEEAVAEKAQAEAAEARTKARMAQDAAQALQAEQAVKLQAMRQAELEHARARVQNIVSPYQEALDKAAARLNEAATELLVGIRKNGHLKGQASGKAKGLHDLMRTLTSFAASGSDVAELEQTLAALDQALKPAAGTMNNTGIEGLLAKIVDQTAQAAQDVARRAVESKRTRASYIEVGPDME